jgi:hypothetical protein
MALYLAMVSLTRHYMQSIRVTDIPNDYGRESLIQSVINRYTWLVHSDCLLVGESSQAFEFRDILSGVLQLEEM